MEEEIRLTNDLVFQRIFGKVGNENITKAFLEKVLGIEIESLTLDTNKRLIGERPEDNWIRALKSKGVDEMGKISELDKQIKEMKEELERITADPELREKYYQREKNLRDALSWIKAEREEAREQGRNEGREEGKAEGKAEGIEENRKEIVLNMYKKNIDIETISEIVKLSKKEIEKIIKEN